MKHAILAFSATALLAGLPGPASATGSPAAVFDAGRCIVQQDRRTANMLMATLPLDDTAADLSRLRGRAAACAGSLAGAPAMQVRGALAQAMFVSDFGSFDRQPDPRRGFINLNLPVETSPAGSRSVELYRWADCVVRNDAAGTERLLGTGAGSPEESAAISGLQLFMSLCMPAGAQLTVRPWEVRSVFAQTAYNTAYRYWTGRLTAVRGT